MGKVGRVQVRAVTPAAAAGGHEARRDRARARATHTATERAAIDTSTMDGDDGADSVVSRGRATRSRSPATRPGSAAAVFTPRPVIYSRAQWGADERMRSKSSLHYGDVHAGFVHHTVNANDYTRAEVPALLRSIYAYHVQSRGWSDIGYNYLIDRFGRIWEGRYGGIDRAVVGAHTLGYNDDSFAASAIGNYEIDQAEPAMLQAYAALFAWKLSLHGVDASLHPAVRHHAAGSRRSTATATPAATACPGQYLYDKIPAIRKHGRGRPARLVAGASSSPTWPRRRRPDIVVRRASDGEAFVVPTGGLIQLPAPRPRSPRASAGATERPGHAATSPATGRSDLLVRQADGSARRPARARSAGTFGAADRGAHARSAGKDQVLGARRPQRRRPQRPRGAQPGDRRARAVPPAGRRHVPARRARAPGGTPTT